ncbi:MAG: lytic transglycosylase domain-containing protein [Terracidiphilus sp.]
MRGSLLITAGMMATLVAMAPSAQAAERIRLRNGFEMHCDHHAEVEGRTRLYLSAGEDSYIEFRPEEIAAVETVPDPPATKSTETPAQASRPSPQSARKSMGHGVSPREAKLSEADLGEMLTRAGHAHNLDVDLLASLVKAESNGDAHAVSRAGAEGLMQLMPATAKDMGVTDSFKPDDNVRGGATYLDELLTRYHDNLALALAAYNAGPEAVDRYHGIPPYHETRAYVARVIHEFNRRVLARETQAKRAAQTAVHQGNASR